MPALLVVQPAPTLSLLTVVFHLSRGQLQLHLWVSQSSFSQIDQIVLAFETEFVTCRPYASLSDREIG
ncbi:hypothetical protein BQ8482_260012 [Mesorhizobium delmotii]|uniref:Uncharacterized protein n=1 Tax=Mesorhizobium delmotii TaxID=1631247 RepID=A0A2P9AM89_9HYPH|nr:hypothetical protein BQ8482_260012 [Mesorhizobium delmotii]